MFSRITLNMSRIGHRSTLGGSIRKDLRRRTIQGQYVTVTKMGGYRRRHGQWSPAGHPAKYWLDADVTRGRRAVWRRAGRRYDSWVVVTQSSSRCRVARFSSDRAPDPRNRDIYKSGNMIKVLVNERYCATPDLPIISYYVRD